MKLSRMVIWALVGAAFVWVLLMWFVPGSHQDGLFFCSAREYQFCDFFCPRSVLAMVRPYAEAGMSSAIGNVQRADQCYPALAVFLSGLFPETVMGAIACQALGSVVYFLGVWLYLGKYGVARPLLMASLLVSAPYLFAAEVGNQILYAAGASFVFLSWYDSNRRSCRVLAVFALAVAAVLKIAPAILGLAWLCSPQKRDWRGAFLSAGVFILLLVVPFAFWGGIDGCAAWFENARANAQVYATRNELGLYGLIAELTHVVGYNGEVMPLIHGPLRLLSSLLAVVLLVSAFLRESDEFLRLCRLTLGMLFLPPTMMCYTVLYAVPLFIVGTCRSEGPYARSFALCWLTSCLSLRVPLLLGSANVCFAAAAILDLSCLLLHRSVRAICADRIPLVHKT